MKWKNFPPPQKTAAILAVVVVCMIGLSFASVPLYRMFCQLTGFDGTPQRSAALPAKSLERMITVRFNTDVDPNLPWTFQPHQREIKIKVGEAGHIAFTARNNGLEAAIGTSAYNVTPEKAGIYFQKVQCFCFEKHRLEAGQAQEFPVIFFIDPAIAGNRLMNDVDTITLSYTFFPAKEQTIAKPAPLALK
ncbi:MAG: cytochrome c oxidase assembly protein [Dongiaceae bacterium]